MKSIDSTLKETLKELKRQGKTKSVFTPSNYAFGKGEADVNKCFSEGCNNQTATEFCPECLANGGVIVGVSGTNEGIENIYTYHAPKEGQPEKYSAIRDKAKELAYLIEEECPNSREKSVALTNLETAVMWANASIARNE